MIQPYTTRHIPAVREFNRRLIAGGADPTLLFPEDTNPGWLPNMELFVSEEEDAVHGGYILRHQNFPARGPPWGGAPLPSPLLWGRRRPRVPFARSHRAGARGGPPPPPLRPGNGRLGQAASQNAEDAGVAYLRRAVPFQSRAPAPFP